MYTKIKLSNRIDITDTAVDNYTIPVVFTADSAIRSPINAQRIEAPPSTTRTLPVPSVANNSLLESYLQSILRSQSGRQSFTCTIASKEFAIQAWGDHLQVFIRIVIKQVTSYKWYARHDFYPHFIFCMAKLS